MLWHSPNRCKINRGHIPPEDVWGRRRQGIRYCLRPRALRVLSQEFFSYQPSFPSYLAALFFSR